MTVLRPRGPEVYLADATLYLELFGIVSVAWQWLLQAAAAQRALEKGSAGADDRFYRGKLVVCRYFFAYELPKIDALIQRLTDNDPLTAEMDPGLLDT